MTDVEVLEREIECVKRKGAFNCSDCENCDLLMDEERIIEAYENAMDALKTKKNKRLKECPFCGGIAGIIDYEIPGRDKRYQVCCYDCGASGPETPAKDSAIKSWNRRWKCKRKQSEEF